MKLLRDLLTGVPAVEVSGRLDTPVRGIAYDSRRVSEGFLFVALRGTRTDGSRYVEEALKRGAAAVASETSVRAHPGTAVLKVADGRRFLAEVSRAYFDDPAERLRLVAITGTNGKTTTSYILDAVFRGAGLKSCLSGTIGTRIGSRSFPAEHTTPESPDLTRFLADALAAGCTHGSLEVSSHALSQQRVFGTKFTVGVFTNLTPEHLDFHGDMESYYKAKRLLFSRDGGNKLSLAVVNVDDPYGRRLAREASCPVLRYGYAAESDVRFVDSEVQAGGTALRIGTSSGDVELRTRLVGRPNIYNIMAATAAALGLRLGTDAIAAGIGNMTGVPGRMEPVDAGQSFAVFVDYAHTPDALDNLLRTAAGLPHARIVTVFGCGGDRDRTKRRAMGEIAGRGSDVVIATSDNPRTEDPLAILAEIEPGLRDVGARYEVIADRRSAIARAVSLAQPGDIVLIAGKGHEDYQIIGNSTLPFDDRAVAREVLRGAQVGGASSTPLQ